ncbi:MAG: hypothetical protein IKR08_02805 [Firmicutes bacterium]|nr:hypothetical protein [Bacillota bacterium]
MRTSWKKIISVILFLLICYGLSLIIYAGPESEESALEEAIEAVEATAEDVTAEVALESEEALAECEEAEAEEVEELPAEDAVEPSADGVLLARTVPVFVPGDDLVYGPIMVNGELVFFEFADTLSLANEFEGTRVHIRTGLIFDYSPETGDIYYVGTNLMGDPETGYVYDSETGRLFDPRDNFTYDSARDVLIDPATGLEYDPETGLLMALLEDLEQEEPVAEESAEPLDEGLAAEDELPADDVVSEEKQGEADTAAEPDEKDTMVPANGPEEAPFEEPLEDDPSGDPDAAVPARGTEEEASVREPDIDITEAVVPDASPVSAKPMDDRPEISAKPSCDEVSEPETDN